MCGFFHFLVPFMESRIVEHNIYPHMHINKKKLFFLSLVYFFLFFYSFYLVRL